mgnify:CR=1 FL=1|tara:strand:+ start:2402 stop:2827 length:426 start_codon:yes stop_codon:yes gene_type:complete
MAGLGKYKKGAKFTLKSGNTPLFKQMGSSTPLYETTDGNNTEENTDVEDLTGAKKDKEVPVNPDKPLAKAGKVMFNALAGGLNAIQKNKIKELKINWDKNEEKRKEESDANTPGAQAVNDIMKGTGIWKPIVPFDPSKSKK